MSIRPRRSKSPTITIDRRYAPPERGRWEASKIERGCLRFVRRPLCPYCSSGTFPDTQFSEGWKNSPDSPFFLPTPRQSRAVMEFDRDFSLRQTFVPFALRPYDGFLHAGYCRLMIRCVALRRAAPHCTFPASCPAPLFGEAFFAPRRFSVRIGFVQRAAPPRPGIRRNLRCRLPRAAFRRGVLRSPPVFRPDRIRTARRSSSARNTPQPSLSPALCRFFRNSIYSLVVPCRFPTIRTVHPLPLSLLLLAAAPRRLRIRSRFFPPTSLRLLRPRAAKHPPAFRRA